MKNALIVANSSGLITLFLKNDIELLKNRGYKIDCACNTNFPDFNTEIFFKEYGINVIHIDFPIRSLNVSMLITSYYRFKKILKMGDYDIIHCHSTIVAALVRQCTKKIRKSGTKVIYTSHGFPFYEEAGKKKKLYKIVETYYSRFTDAIITICSEDYKSAAKMYCKKVFKISGVGVNLDRFNIENFDRESYRKKLGFQKSNKVILSIGELNTNKNHQVIIRAIAFLNDPAIVYAICGREVTEAGKKEELISLANQLKVNVTFLGFRSDIPEVCHSADIGALPSLKEGLGLSGIEMLASGIPVVGANRQGIKDYIINGKTGFLCDPKSAESFADGIQKTLELCEIGSTKDTCINISKEFDVKNSRKKMDSIYREVLGEK